MPSLQLPRPRPALTGVAAAAALAATCVAAPAPAHAAGLLLSVAPDKAAPEGKTPKVVFTLTGAARGRQYRIEAEQKSGQSPLNEQGYPVVCGGIGRYSYTTAGSSVLKLLPTPLGDYSSGFNSPCTGTYHGEVQTPRRGRPAKILQTFRLQVPAMRLTHVKVLSR